MNISPIILNNFEFYFVKNRFKIVFDNEYAPHVKSELTSVLENFHRKRFFYSWLNFLPTEDTNFNIYLKRISN